MDTRLAAAVTSLLVGMLLCCLPALAPPAPMRPAAHYTIEKTGPQIDWPQYGFDSGHSGYNPKEKTINASNVGQLQQAWSFSTGSGTVAGNVVEDEGVIYAPASNGTLYALDAATGVPILTFTAGAGYKSSGSAPAVDKGLVFTVCTIGSQQGICALNASTAAVKWSYTVPGSGSYAGTPPVVASGVLYYEGCTSVCSYVALTEKTGQVLWTVSEKQTACEANNGVVPSVSGGYVLVAFPTPRGAPRSTSAPCA
jgi:outer membrane protein assembly factor BamB